jgi:tetratricopeptide (TPR) repeat protein
MKVDERGGKMFLTKKGLWKAIILVAIYFILGSFCVAVGILAILFQLETEGLLLYAFICYLCCPLIFFWARRREGVAKFVLLANRRIFKELNPKAFLAKYEEIRNTKDLVVCKPQIAVLQFASLAYDLLDNREAALAVSDEMIAVASQEKKTAAKLMKASLLYSYDRVEEAEALFSEVRTEKMDVITQGMVDSLLKSDRAMAMGDYKTFECYCLSALERKFPKLKPLNKLLLHFGLGEVYEKMRETEKAVPYYQYCVEHGGETAIREKARAALERLR